MKLHPITPQAALHDGATGNSPAEEEQAFAAKFPLRVLVADDDYISRRTLRFMLEGLGYQIETAENGAECLTANLTQHFDVVLLDLDMPVMDGIDCARAMRQAKMDTTLLALTAVPIQIARLASLGAGFNGYLEKPVAMDELKQALRVASFNRAGENI